MNFSSTALTTLALALIAPAAWAQTPPPSPLPSSEVRAAPPPEGVSPPPQGYAPPTPGYAPPPQGYAPPAPGYAPPPPGYAPPPQGYAPPPPGYVYPPMYNYPPPLLARPATLPYKEGYAIPAGYHVGTRMNKGLVIAGAVTFGVSYLPSVLIAGSAGGREGNVMFIPIVGPFILAGRLDFRRSGELSGFSNFVSGVGVVILVTDGLAQAAGAAMLAVGLTHEKKVLVRDEAARSTVRVVPMPLSNGMGIGLVGTM